MKESVIALCSAYDYPLPHIFINLLIVSSSSTYLSTLHDCVYIYTIAIAGKAMPLRIWQHMHWPNNSNISSNTQPVTSGLTVEVILQQTNGC
jgi:hypothetical protein